MSELELTPRDGELERETERVGSWYGLQHRARGTTLSSEPGHGVNCPADHDYHGDNHLKQHKTIIIERQTLQIFHFWLSNSRMMQKK